MELYSGTIVMNRMPGTSLEPTEILGIPWVRYWDTWGRPRDPRGRPWDPRGRPWDARAHPWDPRDVSETSQGRPGTLGDPGDPYGTHYGPQKQSDLDK